MGAPDPENPLFLGFSVLRGGLRPCSRKGPDHGVGVDPETVKNGGALKSATTPRRFLDNPYPWDIVDHLQGSFGPFGQLGCHRRRVLGAVGPHDQPWLHSAKGCAIDLGWVL